MAVTNATSLPADCTLSVYTADNLTALKGLADATNAYYAGTGTTAEITAARAKVNGAAIADLPNITRIPVGGTKDSSWTSGRSDSSYSIIQNCAAFEAEGSGDKTTFGVTAYSVTGTGAGSNGPGTGSLGTLLP